MVQPLLDERRRLFGNDRKKGRPGIPSENRQNAELGIFVLIKKIVFIYYGYIL
jgi:hypothetical protein